MDSGIVSLSDDSTGGAGDDKLNDTLFSNHGSISSIFSNEIYKSISTEEHIFPVILLSNSTKKEDSHAVFCNYCKKNNFTEYRYKCLICNDFDLCGTCFERKIIAETHKLDHPMVRYEKPNELFGIKFENSEINLNNFLKVFENELHHFVSCDGCSMSPIKGLRFKCDSCNNYDLCKQCYDEKKTSLKHSFTEHPVVVQGKEQTLELDVNNIELLNEIGKGAFGTVYQANCKSMDKVVACKVIKINKIEDPAYKFLGVTTGKLYKSYFQELNAYKELKGNIYLLIFSFLLKNLLIIIFSKII
jgi:hypothetical protein